MRRLPSLTATCLGFIAVLCLAGVTGRSPAQDKKDEPKKKEAPKTIELHLLEKNEGASFGDWNVWRYDEGDKAIFLINPKTGFAVYLPWSSNGWVNYRDKDAEWYVLFSKGAAEKQNRDDLKIDPFLKKKAPVGVEDGKYKFDKWTVKVTKDYIDFHNSVYDDRMTIRRATGEVVHNGRTIGDKK